MINDHFKETGLSIVVLDKLNNPIWTLGSEARDSLIANYDTIVIGNKIELNNDREHIVSDIQLVRLTDGWQVNIRVD